MTDPLTSEPSPESLVAALRGPSPRYKRAEVEAVGARLADCEPFLVEVVREIAADPIAWDEAEGHGHLDLHYALILLSHARSRAAHEPLLQLLHHPGDAIDEILGDLVTENLSWLLFVSAAGEDAGLRQLALDKEAGEWTRAAAMDALGLVAHEDPARREGLIALARAVIQDPDEEVGAAVVTQAATLLIQLRHEPSRDLLLDACVEGHLDPLWYMPEDIDDLLGEPPLAPGELVAQARERYEYEDPHDAMSWWACFVESGDEEEPAADKSGDFQWDDPVFRQEEYFPDEHFDAWLDELVDRFHESPEAAALLDLDASFLDPIFRFALDYDGVAPADVDSGTLEGVLLRLFPRKVSMDPDEAGALVREAEAFFRFAGREFGAEHARECCRVLDERLTAELARRLGDASNFGMAKSFFGAGKAAGFDMSNQRGLDAFMLAHNAARLAETEAAPERGDDVPRSDRKKKKKKKKRKLVKKSRRKNR